MQNTGFRHSTSEYEDVNQSTVRATEIGAYLPSNKRSSMIQQPLTNGSNPLPPLPPNRSPSTRSISTVASVRNNNIMMNNENTLFLEMLLPMLDKVSSSLSYNMERDFCILTIFLQLRFKRIAKIIKVWLL
jgi:serine/threonine-protein kinase 24/25/MST4